MDIFFIGIYIRMGLKYGFLVSKFLMNIYFYFKIVLGFFRSCSFIGEIMYIYIYKINGGIK